MKIKEYLLNGILAGICIGIGGSAFLSIENKVIGAVFFSIGLFAICVYGFGLYTGKICYLCENKNKDYIGMLLLNLLGNLIGAALMGFIFLYINPSIKEKALDMCLNKLELNYLVVFLKAFMCDICVFLAVDIYKKKNTIVSIFVFVPAFILCGWEHSIADIYYFAASGIVSIKAFIFIVLVIIGNTIGGLFLPLLIKMKEKK